MGTAIFRRYVLIGAIGQGGVSTVYSAIDARRGRKLAVKILAPAMAQSASAREDVQREALITDRLRHPSVPRVFEYGEAPLPDGTVVPFVVFELLTGVPLIDVLARGPLPWREAVRIAATVADVLAVAHRRGVVHRDLNARNVMVTSTGPKFIDFGLATAAVEDGGVGRPSMLPGRPDRAVAPSHPKTAFASPADDVYTLGVLLYEMLTGRSPYPAAAAATNMYAGRTPHLAPTPVLAIPGLPSRIRDLVRACMAKRPDVRPAGAEVALSLWAVLDTPLNATIG